MLVELTHILSESLNTHSLGTEFRCIETVIEDLARQQTRSGLAEGWAAATRSLPRGMIKLTSRPVIALSRVDFPDPARIADLRARIHHLNRGQETHPVAR